MRILQWVRSYRLFGVSVLASGETDSGNQAASGPRLGPVRGHR